MAEILAKHSSSADEAVLPPADRRLGNNFTGFALINLSKSWLILWQVVIAFATLAGEAAGRPLRTIACTTASTLLTYLSHGRVLPGIASRLTRVRSHR